MYNIHYVIDIVSLISSGLAIFTLLLKTGQGDSQRLSEGGYRAVILATTYKEPCDNNKLKVVISVCLANSA